MKRWIAAVNIHGTWCEFGPKRGRAAAVAEARAAWDELARHVCRPFPVRLEVVP